MSRQNVGARGARSFGSDSQLAAHRPRRRFTARGSALGKHRLSLEPLEQRLALTTLPPGFTETLVTTASDLSSPTAMEISPTGQVWVLEQGGDVEVIRTNGTKFTALDLTVDSAGERGLLGIAFDPSYDGAGPNTDYVYLYYTKPRASATDPANNQVVRYTVNNAGTDSPTLVSELMIRELPPEDEDNNLGTNGDTNHNGGAIHFGPDGKLYVAVGDHNYDPAVQANSPSQQLTTPFGKMLRLNPNGSNPDDNPFFTGSTSDWQGSIWALGLRNPYTFAIDPANGRVFINDVGESQWEEINAGVAGANYGWAGSTSPLWEGFENDGSPPPWSNYHDPIMAYNHSSDAPTPAGVDITGGVFYPANGPFGASFAGKYFFADAGAGFIRNFDPNNPGTLATPDTSSAFASSLTTAGPVDLKVDAAGNLYYLARGGEVYRISYTGSFSATVSGRGLFYNNSSFDGNDGGANAGDVGALAVNLAAYRPGDGLADADNVSSYSRGINGLIIDVAGNHGPLSAADFTFRMGNNNAPQNWAAAPAPTSILVRAGAGVGGSDRVHLVWNDGAIRNTWLQVIVEGNDALGGFNTNTGLAASDVFFWGNKVADSGTSPGASTFETTSTDSAQVLASIGGGKPITDLRDYNRDGQVTSTDSALVLANIGSITRINIAAGGPFAPEAAPLAAPLAASDDPKAAIALALSLRSETSAANLSAPAAANAQVGISPAESLPLARQALEALWQSATPDNEVTANLNADLSATLSEDLLETLAKETLAMLH